MHNIEDRDIKCIFRNTRPYTIHLRYPASGKPVRVKKRYDQGAVYQGEYHEQNDAARICLPELGYLKAFSTSIFVS